MSTSSKSTKSTKVRTVPVHTPGPWHVGEVRPDDDADERMIDGPGGAVICSVWPMGVDFDEPDTAPEREANARLIAKAPEMRDTLEKLLALVAAGSLEVSYMDKRATEIDLADARALLAEIEGYAND